MKKRCAWVPENQQMYIDYHDQEWGVPLHDDRMLFEFLILEGMQAGLSWATVLKKRENFRKAFDHFDPEKVSEYTDDDVERLMNDSGIIRNRAKINAAINNAKCFLEVKKEFGTFDKYIWSFTGGRTIKNSFENISEIPAKTEISDEMSADMKKRGFKFVGSTVCYAHMQATGMVNDHTVDCFRYSEV